MGGGTGQSLGQLRGCANGHLATYLDADREPAPRAFRAYDGPGPDPNRLDAGDLLAPVLLSVPLRWSDITPMFSTSGAHRELYDAMQAVLDDPACTGATFTGVDLDDPAGPWAAVQAAIAASYPVPRWKAVAVTKVLHRKRPHLVPVYDSQLLRFYAGAPRNRWHDHERVWPTLQADLRVHRRWLEELAAAHQPPDGPALTAMRCADIIIWEHQVAGAAHRASGA